MACEVYATLTFADGAVEEVEDSTRTGEVAGVDTSTKVECTSFRWGISAPTEQGGPVQSGRHVCEPIRISFRATGVSTPLWLKALDRNEPVAGTFETFRPSRHGSAREACSTVEITDGRLIGFEIDSPDTLDAETASKPMMCHAILSYHTLVHGTDGGSEHVVSWGTN